MALDYKGTITDNLPDGMKPSGYTDPTVTTFEDGTYARTVELSIAKATVENATRATTLNQIRTDVTVGIDKQISDILTNDYDVTNTVEAYGDLKALRSNIPPNGGTDSEFLTDTAVAYVAVVDIYVKVS